VIPFRAALLIDAPAAAVRAALWSATTWRRAAAAGGLAAELAGPSDGGSDVHAGDLMRLSGGRHRMLLRVGTQPSLADGVLVLRGIGRPRGLVVTVTPAPTPAGTLVTVDVRTGRRAPGGRPRILRRAQLFLGVLLLAAREQVRPATPEPDVPSPLRGPGASEALPPESPSPIRGPGASEALPKESPSPSRIVVAGVVVRDGAVLAARRTYPAQAAGHWECPGGKVEPGESEPAALVRELAEELGITVTVRDRVGPALPLAGGYRLHAYRADLVRGEPEAREHDAVRWVPAAELDSVRWLPSDRPLVPFIRQLLDAGSRAGSDGGRRAADTSSWPVGDR
jgi:8-oxo-dGTP diphosphatase